MHPPLLMNEGSHVDHFGNLIWSTYVDFRDPSERLPINRLVKGCRKEYAIEICRTFLISRPRRFRDKGEGLIRDPGEAYASQETITYEYEAVDDPHQLAEAHRRDRAVNRTHELVGSNNTTKTTSVRQTQSKGKGRFLDAGRNWWIFCTSIEPPTNDDWNLWRATLEDDYDHVSFIQRPREFARALAIMVAEQQGPQGGPSEMTHSFDGEPSLRTEHRTQWVFHGPVIYVDDVYALIQAATSKHELALLPLFAKNSEYRDQREYRFAIPTEVEPASETVLLEASSALLGNMTPKFLNYLPQIAPRVQFIQTAANPAEDDLDDEFHGSSEDSGSSLIDRLTGDTGAWREFASRILEQGSKSATFLRPNRLEPDAPLPDDFMAATAVYPAVVSLRNKVNDVRMSDDASHQQGLEAASAAWYAEQHIRSLCDSFEDPVSGVSITPDGCVVVEVTLREHPYISCKMAVAPTGQCTLKLEIGKVPIIFAAESVWPRSGIGEDVRRYLNDDSRNHCASEPRKGAAGQAIVGVVRLEVIPSGMLLATEEYALSNQP